MPTKLCKLCEMETETEEMRKGLCPWCFLQEKERELDEEEPLAVDEMMQKHRRRWK